MKQTSALATTVKTIATSTTLDIILPEMRQHTLILNAPVSTNILVHWRLFSEQVLKLIKKKSIISIFHFLSFYKAHCQQATFDVGIQTYDALSKINIREEEDSIREEEDRRHISIYYATTGVRVSTTSALIDLATFISNVGGNLGLFVEFSILGGLFFVYDFLAVRFPQWINEPSKYYARSLLHQQSIFLQGLRD